MSGNKLSVIVATTENGEFLEGALKAIIGQKGISGVEVIVPIDKSIKGIDSLRSSFPSVWFLDVENTSSLTEVADIGVAHLAIDKRRAAGLKAAHGDIVALTEEHARPAPDWCVGIIESHKALYAVIGGAIENANPRLINWALYFMDAGRYQNPLPEGPSEYISDVNVSYKRPFLKAYGEKWRYSYHETGLHDAMRAAGETLWLTPRLVVWQDRGEIGLVKTLRERFAWGRLYAGRRCRDIARNLRFAFAFASPLLTLVFPVRAGKTVFLRRRHRLPFLKALPLLVIMSGVWSIGECTGYLTGRATKRLSKLSKNEGVLD